MQLAYIDSGKIKGFYYGYSAGSIQAFIALSKFEVELSIYVEKAIFLAPCNIVLGDDTIEPGLFEDELKKAGVYALFGPNFNTDKICELSSEAACGWAGLME